MSSIELRPAVPGDAPLIHALVRASEDHDRAPQVTPLQEIEELLEDPFNEPADNIRLAVRQGRVVGYGTVWHRPSTERQEVAFLFGTVHPDHRNRGVGRIVFGWQVERGTRSLAVSDHNLPRYLRTNVWDWLTDAQHLYERFGFTPVRWFDELLRPLDPPLSTEQVIGVDIAPWGGDHHDDVRRVHNASFADHWGSPSIEPEAWSNRIRRYGVRLDLSFVAIVDGDVVGYALNEVFPEDEPLLGRRDGWIGGLGVLQGFRGRGVASALIAASLGAFRQAGLTHAAIGVDADNPTGAPRLYRRLGFRPEHRSIAHELEV